MKRSTHRRDSTHAAVISALREEGFACVSSADLGGFVGDIVVAARGENLVLEVKPEGWTRPRNDRERVQAGRRSEWRSLGGQVEVVRTAFEAIQFVRYGLGPGLV